MKQTFNKISIFGLGYIGLPTAAIFSNHNKHVIGVDINEQIVKKINCGEIHIIEKGLGEMVCSAVQKGCFRATTIPEPADAFFIAVPTPFLKNTQGNPAPDLSHIESASKAISSVLQKGNLVVLESTSPVGATEQMMAWMARERPDLTFPNTHGQDSDVRIAYCPERVIPGNTLKELVENDRVIGGVTPKCSSVAEHLYKTFVQGNCIKTDARTAEMCKITENSFRDVNIAFANELSMICDTLDINVWNLIKLANRHPRVNILQPGTGVGGHCIAVDPWFIVDAAPTHAKLIRCAREINDSKPLWVLKKVQNIIKKFIQKNPTKSIESIKIACYGITFKPNIDDIRESPALGIVEKLSLSHPGPILVVEPNLDTLPSSLKKQNVYNTPLTQAIAQADIHVLLLAHKPFKEVELDNINTAFLVDTQGIWCE